MLPILPAILISPPCMASPIVDSVMEIQAGAGSRILVGVVDDGPSGRLHRATMDLDPDRARVVYLPDADDTSALFAQRLVESGLACGVLVRAVAEDATNIKRFGTCTAEGPPLPPPPVRPEAREAPPPAPRPPRTIPPGESRLVVHVLHLRSGGAGVSWDNGALADIRLGWKSSLVGSGMLYVGGVVAFDAAIGVRWHPIAFDHGLFVEGGGGAGVSNGPALDQTALDLKALVGWRWRLGFRPQPFFGVIDLGIGGHVDRWHASSNDSGFYDPQTSSLGLLLQLDGGFGT